MLKTVYLGVDIGSISTKGVLINKENEIVAQEYLWTKGNPIAAVQKLIFSLRQQIDDNYTIAAAGTTGSARKLIGAMIGADVVKNEITAHAVGTLSRRPDVRTILEIGGQDSKIILLDNGVVVDYAMNTLCAAGTGAFLSSQASRLGIAVEELGTVALTASSPSKIAARCTVFAESDMIHKAQAGHKKEDLAAGLCSAVVSNYLNNVAKGKHLQEPVVFQGGVSKNKAVVQEFIHQTGMEVAVDECSHLLGAVGAAILSKSAHRVTAFQPDIAGFSYHTTATECNGCANCCEIVSFYRNEELIDAWGNRCAKGEHSKMKIS